MPAGTSSGDLLADKRFAYAEALAAEGDLAAAADLYAQVAELAPDWAPAHLALGLALERLGDRVRARAALAASERLDPGGTLGAALHHARLTGTPMEALPPRFVAALFDQYADRFDSHLTGSLAYRGPEVILQCLARHGVTIPTGALLDLGCGTGLMARALDPHRRQVDGIDLSAAMVARARATGLYRTLLVGDGLAGLSAMAPGSYEGVFAADVLVYMGDLRPLMAAVARVLTPGGLFAATAQAGEANRYALGDDLRFAHGPDYMAAVLRAAAFDIVGLDPCTTRREAGHDVPGLVFVARTP